MKKTYALYGLIILAIAIIAAVSFHSVEEIHYLKSFYPDDFTVEQAFYASLVEVIKIGLVSFPLCLGIGVCIHALNRTAYKD